MTNIQVSVAYKLQSPTNNHTFHVVIKLLNHAGKAITKRFSTNALNRSFGLLQLFITFTGSKYLEYHINLLELSFSFSCCVLEVFRLNVCNSVNFHLSFSVYSKCNNMKTSKISSFNFKVCKQLTFFMATGLPRKSLEIYLKSPN